VWSFPNLILPGAAGPLPAVAFEVESSWRTRKHIKGDCLSRLFGDLWRRRCSALVCRVDKRPVAIGGAILAWGAITAEGRTSVIERFGLADVLSLEVMIDELDAWGSSIWRRRVDELKGWSDELFGYLRPAWGGSDDDETPVSGRWAPLPAAKPRTARNRPKRRGGTKPERSRTTQGSGRTSHRARAPTSTKRARRS